MPAKVNEREYRDITLSRIEIRESQDGKKVVEGYATTFNEEYIDLPRREYTSDMAEVSKVGMFITEDEIDATLTRYSQEV